MISVNRRRVARVCQGDIFQEIEFVEHVRQSGDSLEISKIIFPLVIVLTQDCDLAQDYGVRWSRSRPSNTDKQLFSVLVAPLYNVEHVYDGTHLSALGLTSQLINKKKSPGENLRKNETPRYHYLEFPESIPLVNSVIDFKHYFSTNVEYLKQSKRQKFVCQVGDLYREDISQRFASFLSRIGLP
jgi:hypothetical protein